MEFNEKSGGRSRSGLLITPKFRASFAFVINPNMKAHKKDPTKPPKYELTALFPADADLTALKKAAAQVLIDKFGADQTTWPKKLHNPFKDQGDYEYDGYVPGQMMIRMSTKNKPGVITADGKTITEEQYFYSGCYACAIVTPFWFDMETKKGVSFGLEMVQKLGEGDPLGGRARVASEEFEAVADDMSKESAGSIFG